MLIGAPDAHAKNYSLMLGGRGAVSLAPLYDVASILPYNPGDPVVSAMKIGDAWESTRIGARVWEKTGRQLRLRAGEPEERVVRLSDELPAALSRAARDRSEIPAELRESASVMVDRIAEQVARVGP